jgi:acetyl-CoA acetyltransferase family protein
VTQAARAIAAGDGDVFIAGGVESMSRAPYVMLKPSEGFARGAPEVADTVLGWRFINPRFPDRYTIQLGQTAEVVAAKYGVTRAAQQAGRFTDELVAVPVPRRRGEPLEVAVDEHPRPDTTLAQLARLSPAFQADGTVTAGNSSGLNDGAAALVVVSAEAGRARGLRPLARIVATGVAGVAPDEMGMGPVPAARIALERAGIGAHDVALAEVNEAFAAQALPCIEQIGLDPDIVNVNGGAIALGHPLGCSGARILITLVHELRRRGGGYGLATMCIGVGQGIATVVEVDR